MNKESRLTNNASFNYIYKHGAYLPSRLFGLLYVKASTVKVGIVVSKKIGKSVVRNLIKRRIKENFRLILPELTAKANYVVSAKEGIEKASYEQIGEELRRLLKKAGHLTDG